MSVAQGPNGRIHLLRRALQVLAGMRGGHEDGLHHEVIHPAAFKQEVIFLMTVSGLPQMAMSLSFSSSQLFPEVRRLSTLATHDLIHKVFWSDVAISISWPIAGCAFSSTASASAR
jgi:hypothetical protein